jgi:uncharacterized protein (UPF0210 family)
MNLHDKSLCKIRTITTFITLNKSAHDWRAQISKATHFCHGLAARFTTQGYTVQSIRIVTNPFGEYLDTRSVATARSGLQSLTQILSEDESDLRIRFAIGEARTAHEIALLPELIRDFGDLCNACVNVSVDEHSILDNDMIREATRAVHEISRITERAEGNFNFTVNFNCDPLIPYFPASYHRSEAGDCFVIGLETPDLLVAALQQARQNVEESSRQERFRIFYDALAQALQFHIDQVIRVIEGFPAGGFLFRGIDSSAAPSKECSSMAEVYHQLGVEYFGASGTVEASALLTRVFKSLQGVELAGFSGLMLALTEDRGLAQASINNEFEIRSLLTYSAVCGIGLDTVPIPGDTPARKIEALMRDTGTMAFHLNKPLTVRLFPLPGFAAGDLTRFESADLCNCAVLAVP